MDINLLHGDCLELMKDIPDKSVDMILCDLPYGTTQCSWDTIIPFEPLWEQYERIIKDNGAIVLTASQPFASALVMSNPKLFKYEWIWDKVLPTGFAIAKHQPMKQHEQVIEFGKGKVVYNPILPTQKPVPLFEYLIKTYTNEVDTVLDNCMGSGTTGVACLNTNRNFIGIELDDKYFEIAKRRISKALNKPEQITI